MATVEITDDNFREIYQQNDIIILDFWAIWCGPCQQFGPIFEEASEDHPDVVFGKVDTEVELKLAEYFGIKSIPTIVIVREGITVYFRPGVLSRSEISQLVQKTKALDMEAEKNRVDEEDRNQ